MDLPAAFRKTRVAIRPDDDAVAVNTEYIDHRGQRMAALIGGDIAAAAVLPVADIRGDWEPFMDADSNNLLVALDEHRGEITVLRERELELKKQRDAAQQALEQALEREKRLVERVAELEARPKTDPEPKPEPPSALLDLFDAVHRIDPLWGSSAVRRLRDPARAELAALIHKGNRDGSPDL